MEDTAAALEELNSATTGCRICERLTRYREDVSPRKSFAGSEYWRKPVPSFGDPNAWLLILGLAPAAHGGNRTGRVFTGDESGRFLVEVLHATGFANQPTSTSKDDGLALRGCYIMAAVRCAPPGDRPSPQEFSNCRRYMVREIELLANITHVLALGRMAFDAYLEAGRRVGSVFDGAEFRHGSSYACGKTRLYASYHPSPRNTRTGRLTRTMLIKLLEKIRHDRLRSGSEAPEATGVQPGGGVRCGPVDR